MQGCHVVRDHRSFRDEDWGQTVSPAAYGENSVGCGNAGVTREDRVRTEG